MLKVLTAVLVLGFLNLAIAGDEKPAAKGEKQAKKPRVTVVQDPNPDPIPQRTNAGGAGLVAAIDPVTGELVLPTAEQMAELTATSGKKRSSDFDVKTTTAADGTVTAVIGTMFDSFTVVYKSKDGTFKPMCTKHPEKLHEMIAAAKKKEKNDEQ